MDPEPSDITIKQIAAPITVSPTSLSGYAGLTDFTFTSLAGNLQINDQKISTSKLIWDFGDGNTLSGANANEVKHKYNYPGVYTIKASYYDGSGKAYLGTLSNTVTCYNFKESKLTLEKGNKVKVLQAGKLDKDSNSISVYARVAWQNYDGKPLTVFFTASGSKSKIYDEYYKFAHLLPFRSFYTIENASFTRTNKLTIPLTPKYYELDTDGETPIEIEQDIDENGIWSSTGTAKPSGTILYAEGNSSIYYFDDLPGFVRVIGAMDTSNYKIPDLYINDIDTNLNTTGLNFMESNVGYVNLELMALSARKLVFTSTGLKNMPVSYLKKEESPFQVFVAAADVDGNILKYYPQFKYVTNSYFDQNNEANTFTALEYYLSSYPLTGNTQAEITTDQILNQWPIISLSGIDSTNSSEFQISSLSTNKFPYDITSKSTLLSSFGYLNVNPTNNSDYGNILAVSARPSINGTDFNLITGGFHYYPTIQDQDSRKNNEDFNYGETLKDYRLQDILVNEGNNFFEVLSAISNENINSFGTVAYEKIANYVSNIKDIDTSNISVLKDHYQFFGTKPSFTLPLAPPEIRRLYDIYSISTKKLLGDQSKFNQNFDTRFSRNSAYGINLDYQNPISVETYTVTAGTNFVARLRFSNEFILIEPMKVPVTTIEPTATTSQYPLSNYGLSSTWGWPLEASSSGLSSLYDFFPFVEAYDGYSTNNVLNLSGTFMTSYVSTAAEWDTKIIYNEIDNQIRNGVNI